ncbi:hypothetical protein [Spiroplasma endosymbiont of Danaus chrysippus]|uniref:hypothetical protein n=1 Tax=Spiroplasma endosymbiont of Danaus chrysippus TaxID=2691041 RepID=UPI0013C9BE52|nr:hypothetical protein [Spiroplasma endosymbiont of Danaus chrysippus]CAB1053951.1 hypothetical protein [Spiroplasma endosymbiont of Danaus chrysippus]
MAIKDPLMFITIEEFKNWKGFNKSLFDEVTTPDSEIRYAIEIASSNIDYLSGFTISKKWPEITPTKFTDNIQTATTHYVNFLLGKGVEYARGQASIGQGGITYSQNNPEDPYYIVPQVFNYLKEINEYPTMKGFDLNVSSKQNWFKKFMGSGGEQNPWEIYLQTLNLKSSDPRTKISITHPKNIMGSVVDIDTTGIKSFDNLTTLELFNKYFSNDTMKLVDGKEGQEKKVISANSSGESLWEVDKDNPNFIKPKDYKGIDVNGKRIIDVGTPTFLSDATTKVYVDNLLDKKQNKLIAGENITIDKETNTISATGGSSESLWEVDPNSPNIIQPKEKRIITSNNTRIVDIGEPEQEKDATTKQYVDNLLDKKQDKEKWLIVATSVINGVNQTITYDCKENRRYRIWFNYGIRRQSLILSDIYIYEEFIYSKGSNTELTFDINHSQPYLICNRTNTPIFTWLAGNTRNGNLWKLEELEENNENIYKITSNTLNIISPNKINMNKPIKIISNNLETNEIEENCWDIELKNNPIPSIPKWKEVGTKININHIKYTFKSNTKYKIYYNFESQTSSKKFAFMCKEFLYGELNKEVQTLDWDNINGRIMLSLQMQNDTIAIVSDPTRFGQLLKLEELQE